MSEGHQSKLLRTDTLHDETEKWSSTGKQWKKKEMGARNQKESLLEQRTKSKTSCPPIHTQQN